MQWFPRCSFTLALLMAACAEKPVPAPPSAPPEPDTAERPTTPPEDGLAEIFAYSPIGKRDPFKTFIDPPTRPTTKLHPLQKWDVDQLHLVAIVTGVPAPYAMVEDPRGKGHVVRRGALIGKNWGRVSSIAKRKIAITERRIDYTGRKFDHTMTMTIPRLPRAGDEDLIDG